VAYAFEQTQGQPWLANAIACECVEEITRFDYTIPITKDLVDQAIQRLVLARGTHFDSMIERLKEKRVRSVIEPLILGEEVVESGSDDYLYTRDLGLIREMALGSRRADLCVIYGVHKYPIEIKLLKGAKTIPEGLAQIADYMDKVGESQGSLVIFDRDAEKPWEEKIYMRTEARDGKMITVAGC